MINATLAQMRNSEKFFKTDEVIQYWLQLIPCQHFLLCTHDLLIGDNVSETDNPLIMRAQEDMLAWDDLEPILNDLQIAITGCDQKKLRELLIQIVPGFKPQCEITDVLYKKVQFIPQ